MKPADVWQGIPVSVKEATALSYSLFSVMFTLYNLGMEMALQNLVDAADQ
jgi:hypothetical protein